MLKINKELLQGLVGDWEKSDQYKIVYCQINDTGRWSIHYDCVLHDVENDRYYDASHSEGATEMQDECAFEHDEADENGDITLKHELEPYQETVTKYRDKK